MSNLLGELKRRNVIRVALLYVVGSWLVLQVGEILFEALELPDWTLKFILAALLLGFPLVLIFSWVYEITPEGIKREQEIDRSRSITHQTARKLDVAVIVVVLVALAIVLLDRFAIEARSPSSPITAADPVAPSDGRSSSGEPVEPSANKSTAGATSTSRDPAADSGRQTSRGMDTAPAGNATSRSVAVLPFTTRSNDPEDAFFAEGMHDDLLTQLAKIGALKVISRTSVMEYRDTTKKVPQIADELNVATVVEGAVQRAGSRVRINAQLIDAGTDQHLWAETFDRELSAENIFEIQTEIARSIADALQAALTPEEQKQLGRVLTDNLQAWEAYRRGLRLLDGITPEEYRRAALEARRALELDPDFAAAYGILARVHMSSYWFYGADPVDREAAWEAIQVGREIDPDSPQLDIAEAYYHYWGHLAYDKALAALNRAIKAIPNDAELYKVRGYTLRRAGRFSEAIKSLEHAHSLDPRNPLAAQTLMETYVALGQFEKARRWGEIAAQVNPDSAWLSVWRGELALAEGELSAAIHAFSAAGTPNAPSAYRTWFAHLASERYEDAVKLSDFSGFTQSNSALYPPRLIAGITHHVAGNHDDAMAALSQVREALEAQLADNPDHHKLLKALCQATGAAGELAAARDSCARTLETALPDRFDLNWVRLEAAQGLAMAGAVDEALKALEGTLDNPARPRANVLRINPMLEDLHDDPRFEPLLERIDRVEDLE